MNNDQVMEEQTADTMPEEEATEETSSDMPAEETGEEAA